jgi:nanoRNase/pAp phosphatase (c-di-AMP/oligoRNAs hydrolase)
MTEFLKILSDYQGSRLLVLGHNEADSDALGAAYVLAQVFGGALAVPQAISEHARELQYKLKMKVVFQPDLINYDLIILVDCADPQQLPGCMPKEYLLIDHHSENKLAAGALAAIHELTDSTCQLVWRVCRALGEKLDANLALALGAGIMGDTRYLAAAANSTLVDLAEILEEGAVSYQDLLRVLRVTSRIEREVRLRAAFSAQLHKLGSCLVAVTSAERNYVYYVAMMLLELGADVAISGYQRQESCFIRLAKNPASVHCLDLFSVLKTAVRDYAKTNLWGSGEYAGYNGEGQVEEITAAIITALKNMGLDQCREVRAPIP